MPVGLLHSSAPVLENLILVIVLLMVLMVMLKVLKVIAIKRPIIIKQVIKMVTKIVVIIRITFDFVIIELQVVVEQLIPFSGLNL